MKVSVAYHSDIRSAWIPVWLKTEECCVEEVIQQSGILEQFPDINLKKNRVGIYGKLVKLNSAVADGDRVEIYNPITRKQDDDDDDDDDD